MVDEKLEEMQPRKVFDSGATLCWGTIENALRSIVMCDVTWYLFQNIQNQHFVHLPVRYVTSTVHGYRTGVKNLFILIYLSEIFGSTVRY